MNCRIALIALWVIVFAAPLHAKQLTVSIREKTVTAAGLTPGGGALFFSVAHEPHGFYYTIKRVEKIVADEDRDGTAAYESDTLVPKKSVWCVVDLKTGEFAMVSPEGTADRNAKGRKSRGLRDSQGVNRLEHVRDALHVIIVRPGGDVWTLDAARAGADDEKERGSETYTTALAKFRPLTPDARPFTHLSNADVVLAIDPQDVEFFTVGAE